MKTYKEFINESSLSQLKNIMLGNRKNVKTFGIITAENPNGISKDSLWNKKANKELSDILKSKSYGFRKIKGKFGNIENPFFIINITLSDLKKYANFNNKTQESFIFGKIENNLPTFEYWELDNDTYIKTRTSHIFLDSERNDLYTEYKGGKFIIPFFDKDTEEAKFKNGYLINKKGERIYFDDNGIKLKSKYVEMYESLQYSIDFSINETKIDYNRFVKRCVLLDQYNYFDDDESNYKKWKEYNKNLERI